MSRLVRLGRVGTCRFGLASKVGVGKKEDRPISSRVRQYSGENLAAQASGRPQAPPIIGIMSKYPNPTLAEATPRQPQTLIRAHAPSLRTKCHVCMPGVCVCATNARPESPPAEEPLHVLTKPASTDPPTQHGVVEWSPHL